MIRSGASAISSAAMAPRTVILLPPSEGKVEGGAGAPWAPGTMALPDLDGMRKELLDLLPSAIGADVREAATMPAIERYSGVLYKELDAATIRGQAKRRLDRQVLIVSGLWGAVAPRDPIPYYKLKMAARVGDLGRLSGWWRPELTAALAPKVKGAVVWDLLPNEHAAALDWRDLAPQQRITLRFVAANGKTVSHWNKLLKGSVVRWLAETSSTVDDLADFDHPQGYRLDPSSSSLGADEAALVMRQGS